MELVAVGCSGVSEWELSGLDALHLWEIIEGQVLADCLGECVYHGVGVTLSALHWESTVEETCRYQHLMDHWVAPIVRVLLG